MKPELGVFEEEGDILIEDIMMEVFIGKVQGGGVRLLELLLVVKDQFFDQLVLTIVLCQHELFQFGEQALVWIMVNKDVTQGQGLDKQVHLGQGGGGAALLWGLLRDGTVLQHKANHLEVHLWHVF